MEEWKNVYIGKKYVEIYNEKVKKVKDNIYKEDLPDNTRIIDKDTFVTMDYNKDRLNIFIDNDFIIINAMKG